MRYPPFLRGLCDPFDSLADFDRYIANGSRPFITGISGPNPRGHAYSPLFGWAANDAEARSVVAAYFTEHGLLDHFLDERTPVLWFPPDKVSLLRTAFAVVLADAAGEWPAS